MQPPRRHPGPADALADMRRGVAPDPALDDEGALLLTGSAREVLARLLVDDPLRLGERAAALLAARALLLDAERLRLAALVLCALRAREWRGRPALGRWLEERLEEALADALAEDEEPPRERPHGRERDGRERDGRERDGRAGSWAELGTSVGLDGRELRAGCARFNRLPREQREAFFALVLEGASPDAESRARGLTLTEFARRARAALEALRAPLSRARA